jgi:hypothetical protein
MLPQQYGQWEKFLEEVEVLDNYRNQNFSETFPTWSQILDI